MSKHALAGRLIGNREKAILHIAKSKLGMSEEAYRDMLASVDCRSSVELDHGKFHQIMARLRAAGFRDTHSSARKSGMHLEPAADKKPMLSKISAILADLKLPWSYADGIARQMFEVDLIRWCDVDQTYKILQALIIHQKRSTPTRK